MHGKSLELLVGLFFTLGLGAIFVLTFRVASLSGAAPGEAYSVSAQFQNIGGLKAGAAVTLAGVRIGRVRSISVNRDSYEAVVSLEIAKDYDNIPRDSSAQVLTSGLLGEQYIGLEPGGDERLLQAGDRIILTQSALVLEHIVGQFVAAGLNAAAPQVEKP
ncbi:MAG: outer membrane lipid asymmetry maintenance protein MlaD [Pseudomonadota bacterium]